MEKSEEAKIRLAFLKENFEYQKYFSQFLESDKQSPKSGWPGLGFNKFGLTGLRYCIHHPAFKYEDIIDLVSPQNNVDALSDKLVTAILPRLFYEPAVERIEVGKVSVSGELPDGGCSRPIQRINERGLKPWERLYKVDLTRGKTQILKEYKEYIESAIAHNKKESDWELYKKRNRDEAWTHLEVWKLRKEKKSFSEIARALQITTEAAKKSFYRACEMTQGKRYKPEMLKREIWHIKKEDMKITCNICPQRNNCKTLCPDVLRYIDQDYITQHDNFLPEDSDAKKDFLFLQKQQGLSSKKTTKHFRE